MNLIGMVTVLARIVVTGGLGMHYRVSEAAHRSLMLFLIGTAAACLSALVYLFPGPAVLVGTGTVVAVALLVKGMAELNRAARLEVRYARPARHMAR